MYRHGRRERLTREEFFEKNTENCTPQELAERAYILIHTTYLQERERIKAKIGQAWTKYFGDYMADAAFEYLHTNEMVLTTPSVIRDTITGKEMSQMKYIAKTLTALEFDLWLIECSAKGLALTWDEFRRYAREKYGSFLEKQMRSFQEYDLYYVEDFQRIAAELTPHHKEIEKFLRIFTQANRMKISIENPYADRCERIKRENTFVEKVQRRSEESHKEPVSVSHSAEKCKKEDISVVQPTQEDRKEEVSASQPAENSDKEAASKIQSVEEVQKELTQEVPKEAAPVSQPVQKEESAQSTDKALLREYEIILQEKDKRIQRLENDIREFKRQRDELREYSIGQYDKGVRDFFLLMNDVRYGKIIDYLYRALNSGSLDENMASYMDNLFMLFEDMEIEPVVADEGELMVNSENLTRMFNLDFDKHAFHPARVTLKYAGWKYKDMIMEKPTLTLKED